MTVKTCARADPSEEDRVNGHAALSITLGTYSHAIPALQEEAAALIAGLVFAGE